MQEETKKVSFSGVRSFAYVVLIIDLVILVVRVFNSQPFSLSYLSNPIFPILAFFIIIPIFLLILTDGKFSAGNPKEQLKAKGISNILVFSIIAVFCVVIFVAFLFASSMF